MRPRAINIKDKKYCFTETKICILIELVD